MRAFAQDGRPVVAFVRDPAGLAPPPGVVVRRYSLNAGAPDLDGVETLVHCAFAPRVSAREDAITTNVEGTLEIFRAARARAIRFVFMSSINAVGNIDSAYARQKRAIEERLGAGALVLRPGLVAGDGGLFAIVVAATRRPIVPLIDGGRQAVQLVGIDDLYAALRLALEADLSGAHNVVAAPPLTLRTIVATLLQAQRRRALLLDVPYAAAFAAASIAERCGIALPVTTESLRGLRGARVQEASAALRELGWQPQPPSAVLASFASKGAP
ncbi:MAG: NAD-dependent epimerase/dehydratase [Candidatus Eremiobacteraeota bacterium]|nr:NAD-dependent epimerase/dehydratase [Candidatus Eremiobacteraeota bacterium]